MPSSPDPAEVVRDALLRRLDEHFARPAVRGRLCAALDVAPGTLTSIVQALAVRLFPEAFDEPGPGLVPVGGLPRIDPPKLALYAAQL